MISICIPAYNGQEFLETCLDSASKQSYQDIEIIIVDDCSTDSTWNIATNYAAKDSRIKLFRNEKNLGLVGNWNRCIELAKGEWIKFLFQDDYLDEACIERIVAAILPNDKIIALKRKFIFDNAVSTQTKNYYENEVRTFENSGIKSMSPIFIQPAQIASIAVNNICLNFIGEPTFIIFKRDVVTEVGVFNPDLIQICDLEYFLRIATRYGIKYIPESLAYFRIHGKSTSAANISNRLFTLNNLETIIAAHQFLFDPLFGKFRSALSGSQKIKLKLFFEIRVYESYKNMVDSTSEAIENFEACVENYPGIAKFKKGNIVIHIMLVMVKLRRVFRRRSKN